MRREYCLSLLKEELENPSSPPIKILTGIRSAGKSYILRSLAGFLKDCGAHEDKIIYIDFENFMFSGLAFKSALKKELKGKIKLEGGENKNKFEDKFYIMLDEPQWVEGWEQLLASLSESYPRGGVEFIAALSCFDERKLSKKKSMRGKYVEIRLNTFSFCEFVFEAERLKQTSSKNITSSAAAQKSSSAKKQTPARISETGLLRRAASLRGLLKKSFNKYMECGGFPAALNCKDSFGLKSILRGIYSSIIYYDVILKNKVQYPELLSEIIRFIFENTGTGYSAKNLKKHIVSFFEKTKDKNKIPFFLPSGKKYIDFLLKANLLVKVQNVNLKTGKVLSTCPKYYLKEHSLIFALADFKDINRKVLFENILINELERLGYEVFSSKTKGFNIDFAASTAESLFLIQTLCNGEDSQSDIKNKIESLNSVTITGSAKQIKKILLRLDGSGGIDGFEDEGLKSKGLEMWTLSNFLLFHNEGVIV